ncbi:T9SS type A sorting domain-containing protein [Flavobacterium sp.]|uniref:T9SS type A sorting domain-containing protein n=1 Tax=Flavobacterium sp. TaxID=239 RepID=UPI0037504F10
MKKLYLFFVVSILITLDINGQSLINNHWKLGQTDLNFTNPTPIANVISNTNYGKASISDSSGNLLFYTDGINVWNKNHTIMLNGSNIGYSGVTNTIIVPNKSNPNQYFIIKAESYLCLCFTLEPTNYLYSIVEFNSSNPLGIVLNINPNPIVGSPENNFSKALTDSTGLINNLYYYGALTATTSNDGNYWVIIQSKNKMLSYKIDNLGFNFIPIESIFPANQIYAPGSWNSSFQYVDGLENAKFRIAPNNSFLIGLQYGRNNANDPAYSSAFFYKVAFNSTTGVFSNFQSFSGVGYKIKEFEISNNSNNLFFIRKKFQAIGQNIDGEILVKDININSNPVRILNQFNTSNPSSEFNYIQKDRNGNILISSTFINLNRDKYIHKIENQDDFLNSSVNVNFVYLNSYSISSLPQLIPELLAPVSLCPTLTLTSEPNSGLFTYQNYSTITTQTNYSIDLLSQNISLRASDYITLKPNTLIKTGSTFSAKIQSCVLAAKNSNSSNFEEEAINSKVVKLFPNPNEGSFTVLFNKEMKNTNIVVYDIFGKLVFNTLFDGTSLDLNIPNITSGLYLVKITSNELNETLKFIKK